MLKTTASQACDIFLRHIGSFHSVFRWDFRWVLNSNWDQRPAKSEVVFRLDSAIRWVFCHDQTSDWATVESKAN